MINLPSCKHPVVLINPHRLRAHEEHDGDHARNLRQKIETAGIWTSPVIVEWEDLIVMDGHHRLSVALAAGLAYVPCLLADYHSVPVTSRRDDIAVTPDDIRIRARERRLYPAKTTRHIFPESWLHNAEIGLDRLYGAPVRHNQSVSGLTSQSHHFGTGVA
ncbi:ParB N-terminal domain-containing protein [Thalassospira profundimaris]|uniref:ParB N-terminal domain-containing protein n=1 Tax=Thalassospira profundimaris TaxID=502049 RepID=UPI000DED5F73|nr:ParB N-terminal domain-containing protein [Thalassospira profundimaris]